MTAAGAIDFDGVAVSWQSSIVLLRWLSISIGDYGDCCGCIDCMLRLVGVALLLPAVIPLLN